MAEVNVTVRKGGRLLQTVSRPLHETSQGPAVVFRKRLWPLVNGGIDMDQPSLEDRRKSAPVEEADPFEDEPDASQAAVVALSPEIRAMVDAGPGTGKTHVACERIASLINSGVAPNQIWVISFTRTAIIEFRNRIAQALTDEAAAVSVKIATLDSHAWALQSGFSPDAVMTGSHDENIVRTTERIRDDADAADYLHRLQHLVVDEAQDIIGHRAELISEIIEKLSPACRVTVFADAAQAIYDFTHDASAGAPAIRLLDLLRARGFSELALDRIHRTNDPRLKGIFSDVRKRLLTTTGRARTRCEKVRAEIERLAHADAGKAGEFMLAGLPADTLILLRRRADVLERSGRNSDTPHRLRMSGLPARVLPWLAGVFWDYSEAKIPLIRFRERWESRIHGSLATGAPGMDDAWSYLVEVAGQTTTVVDVHRLRTVAGRQSPPMIFCSPEYGDEGPILGTVHASKGREAEDVRLFLPPLIEDSEDPDEESRISFVGATRARRRLEVGQASARGAPALESGRVWRRTSTGRVQVEIGRDQDLTAAGLTGTACFATEDDARKAQTSWCTTPVRSALLARQERDLEWRYILVAGDERLAVLSDAFKFEMHKVARAANKEHAASMLPYIRSLGLRSIILPPDSPELETLHSPWRQSGFVISPLLTGYSSGRF